MKRILISAMLFTAVLTSCTKSMNVAEYNLRDISAGKLVQNGGNWALKEYYDEVYPQGLFPATTPQIADDFFKFKPGNRIPGDVPQAAGTGEINQGKIKFFPKDSVIYFNWRMDINGTNTVIIEVFDSAGNVIGGNEAVIDGANGKEWTLKIDSFYKLVRINGVLTKIFTNTKYILHALPG